MYLNVCSQVGFENAIVNITQIDLQRTSQERGHGSMKSSQHLNNSFG